MFNDLQPPSGGLNGLRRKLDEPRMPTALLVLAGAIAALLLIVWPTNAPLPGVERFTTRATETLTGQDGHATLKVYEDAQVAIYLKGSVER